MSQRYDDPNSDGNTLQQIAALENQDSYINHTISDRDIINESIDESDIV